MGLKDNTVSAENQLKTELPIFFENKDGNGKRVLFVGNSITLHEAKEEIGWYGNYGMAASEKNKDYVHLIMSKIRQTDPDAAMCIVQAAEWEIRYADDDYSIDWMQEARNFNANVIIMRIVENCNWKSYDCEVFEREYKKVIDYLNVNDAEIILTTGFWEHPLDKVIAKISDNFGYEIVYLGELGKDGSMSAEGKFEHAGVALHPGDKGMAAIAEKIFDVMKTM